MSCGGVPANPRLMTIHTIDWTPSENDPSRQVALDLHGAGVAAGAGTEDLEGAVIAAVRELVGDQIPIVVCCPPD
eukprot:COSAG01_NODE_17_length_39991_cov_30.596160_43_plen_75_part_00